LDELVELCNPWEMEIVAEWSTRGGIHSVITATYTADDIDAQ
jgi:NADPH-dependent 7-cyano-7-deazaguanine reductase QueF